MLLHLFIETYDKIMYCWFLKHQNGAVLWSKVSLHGNRISRFQHSFNNCCLIYIFLVQIHWFLRITFWIYIAPMAWEKKRFSAMLHEISTLWRLHNTILIICIVCEFPLYFDFNKIVILFMILTPMPQGLPFLSSTQVSFRLYFRNICEWYLC